MTRADLIATLERAGACRQALDWLRDQPETLTEAELLAAALPHWRAWLCARRQDLAAPYLAALVADPDPRVREAVARHPDVRRAAAAARAAAFRAADARH